MRETTKCRKIIIFICSALSLFVYVGLLGMISRLKKPMSEDLNLQSSYLGLIDGLKFVAKGLGSFKLLFYPPKHPKRDYLIISVIVALAITFISGSVFLAQFSQPIIAICMLIIGYCRSYNMIPFLILNQYFDSKGDDKKLISGWVAFAYLGIAFSVLLGEFLMKSLNLSWSLCLIIYMVIFLIPIISLSVLTEEVVMEEQEEIQSENQVGMYVFKDYYNKPSNIFHTLQHSCDYQINSSISLWFPYYFASLGFEVEASLILVGFSVSYCLSTPLFELIIVPFESHLQKIIIIMFTLNLCSIFAITQLEEARSSFPLYLGLSVLSAFLLSGPTSRIYSQETKNRAAKGNKEIFMVLNAISVVDQIGTGIDMLIIGYLMTFALKNFIYVILALSAFIVVNQIFRQIVWGQDYLLELQDTQNNNNNKYLINEQD